MAEEEEEDNAPPFTTKCRISGYLRQFVETGMLCCTFLTAKLAIKLPGADTNPYTNLFFVID